MEFEELVLRPASGAVDQAAIAAWLDAQSHVFRDPVADDGWHMSANAHTAAVNRRERLERRDRFPLGIRVLVSADGVVVAARADEDDLARALEFVTWLVRDGGWTVTIDWGRPPEPVGDPRRLFPAGLPDPRTLEDDVRTWPPVSDGKLVTWTDDDRPDRVLVVHTSGAWRFASGARRLHGQLTHDARAAFAKAVGALDSDDPELPDPDQQVAGRLEIEDSDGIGYIPVDPAAPPTSAKAAVALASGWLDALEHWRPGGSVAGLESVQEIG